MYDRIFAASGGYEVVSGGGSVEMRRMLEARLEEQLSSESVSSFGSGELMPGQKERGFRLRVATELILYGATEPDAKVTIQGKVVKLRLQGACRGCPGARMTLKMGIEQQLKEKIPELEEVVAVD